VSDRQKHEYERLKAAIYERLRHRPDFDRVMDSALIDLAARLFADWLYVEGILSSPEGRSAVWKYADGLAKIHSMLIPVLEELRVTPKMRQNIAQDLVESDDVTKRLQKLFEGK
jgi:hypothetical protein